MPRFAPVAQEFASRFDRLLPDAHVIERRKMFGCPCAFVNGNMFAGLHEDRLIVRLPEQAKLRPFTVMGRTMREYAAIESASALSDAELRVWVMRAYDYARTLPEKINKPRRSKARLRP